MVVVCLTIPVVSGVFVAAKIIDFGFILAGHYFGACDFVLMRGVVLPTMVIRIGPVASVRCRVVVTTVFSINLLFRLPFGLFNSSG